MKYVRRILRYLEPHWRLVGCAVALMILLSAAELLSPWPLQVIVDNVLGRKPLPRALAGLQGRLTLLIALSVAAHLAITLLEFGLNVVDNYVLTKIDQSIILDFRSDLFRHAQRLSLTFHDQRRSGMLIYAINFQAGAVGRLVMTVPTLAKSVLTLVGMVAVVFWLDRELALVTIAVVPLLYYCVRYYITHIQQELLSVKGMEGESLSIIHEAMAMLRVIVAFGREDYEHQRFRDQGQRTINGRIRVTVKQTMFSLAVNFITGVGTAAVLGLGAYHVLEGRLDLGKLLVVMAYIARVYKPLETISTTVGALQDTVIALRVAFTVLDTEVEIRDAPGATAIDRAGGRVVFEGLHFNYAGRVGTLRDISFETHPGQVVAVVGPTGAGKTTLVSLIPRFYDPKQGRVLLDGADVRSVTVESLRRQVSVVLQEPLLFSGTIADNIRYGRLEATADAIVEAAKLANAHDFIMGLPQRYDTELGERGAQLSGGERQRIAVAPFLKDAPILILDEPTSSIDSKTEQVILDALDRLMVGRTTFLIAHRLSTVRRADLILVLDKGRLVEQGTHDELLRNDGLYRQLHDLQNRPRRPSGAGRLTGT